MVRLIPIPAEQIMNSCSSKSSIDSRLTTGLRPHRERPDNDALGPQMDCITDLYAHKLANGDELLKESLSEETKRIENALAGPSPSPLETLLAQRASICWLQCLHAENAACGARGSAEIEFQNRQLDRAHKRYLSAMKTLAAVRKLNLPAIQVNIAEKQMNSMR